MLTGHQPVAKPVRTRASVKTASSGLLQRKCGCDGAPGLDGECDECRKNQLQRKAVNSVRPTNVPPIAPELRSPGPQLDAKTRAFVAPRFDHDFSLFSVFSNSAKRARMNRTGGGSDPSDAGVAADSPDAAVSADAAAPPSTEHPATAATVEPAAAAPSAAATAGLSWSQVLRHTNDALWFFCGEHPSGFSTDARLRSTGYSNPAAVNWRITAGADKVAFRGAATGAEVTVESRAGSARTDDVSIEATEGVGGAAPFTGHLTVFKPHRLLHRSDQDHPACPAWAAASCGACPAYWTEIGYRVVDNMGGTIIGATVNENFPGTKTNDQATDWVSPATFITNPFWANTNGTFVDNWFVFCGAPSPVAPGAANAATGVDRIPHEFYVGSTTPARGCRVQTHTAHRYLGFTRHEGVTSPAP